MNDLQKVERQARMLMAAHGFGHLDFKFSRAYRRVAGMHYWSKRAADGTIEYRLDHISFSKKWAMVLPENEIWEVMIHEIAHAMTIGAKRPHGPEFAAAVRKLGGTSTRRCFQPSVNLDGSPSK